MHRVRTELVAVALIFLGVGSAWAQAETEPASSLLRCGMTATGRLAAGATRTFVFDALPGELLAIEAIDIDGEAGLLQVRVDGPGLRLSTCTGRIEPSNDRPGFAGLEGGRYTLRVGDCFGDDPVAFAVTLSLVSDSRRNCGSLLPCGGAVEGELSSPGEVDGLRFSARQGDRIDLRFEDAIDARGGLEVRIFDPDGLPVQENVARPCVPARRFQAAKTGTYTVLLNTCIGLGTGGYRVRWDSGTCPPVTLRGIHSGDGPVQVTLAADGGRVERIAVAGAACGLASFPEFVVPADAVVQQGRFATSSAAAIDGDPQVALRVDADGALVDLDADGRLDQAVGGLSIVSRAARCNFQWAASALGDDDGDGWSDRAERAAGSDPNDPASQPEAADVPTTRLLGPGVCRDFADNDGDSAIDAADAGCQPLPSPPQETQPFVYAGRHADGGAFWIDLSADGTRVDRIAASGLPCLPATDEPVSLAADAAIDATGRFVATSEPGRRLAVEGVFLDGDGDGVADQAVGRMRIRIAGSECVTRWSAAAHADADADGWGDVAERRLGSDPRPMPAGLGGASVPETSLSSAAIDVLGVDVCNDGVDNDGDGRVDGDDQPDCAAVPTPTPTPVAPACGGDCNGDFDITVDEILLLVAASLGSATTTCAAGDIDGSGDITVDEIIVAVNHALRGCALAGSR